MSVEASSSSITINCGSNQNNLNVTTTTKTKTTTTTATNNSEIESNENERQETKKLLSNLIHSLIERKGSLYQRTLIILLCLNSIIIGINHTLTAFHVYVPNFYCRNDPSRSCNVFINGTECPDSYIYDYSDDITIVVEWSLVCSRALLAPLVNTLYFVGVTLGALICSSLCDIFGRKNLVILCLYAQAIMAIGQYFSYNFQLFATFRMIQGFFIQGLQTCSYTLMLEYCPSTYRTKAATIWEANWAIGLGLLGIISYYIREWRMLTLYLTLPAILSLTYSWMFSESLIWLEAKGRHKEAKNLIKKIAKYNRNADDLLSECNLINLKENQKTSSSIVEGNGNITATGTTTSSTNKSNDDFFAIFKCSVLRKHQISMICIWFSVTLSYYGILYFLPNLAGQRHLNFLFGAFIELVAYILAYFILSNFGRRYPMAFYQYGNGILLLIIAVLTIIPNHNYSQYWLIGITLLAKGLAVSSFCGMFIYCSELFPTLCRGIALGLCGFAARCGSLLAPQIMALTLIYPAFIPLAIMSLLLLITATITLFLPETVSTQLPNTILEAIEMWGESEKNH